MRGGRRFAAARRGSPGIVVGCVAAGVLAQAPLRVAIEPAGLPRDVVADVCREADAIWQRAAIAIECRTDGGAADLRVVFDDPTPAGDGLPLTLGWVVFVSGAPDPVIHLSVANTRRLLDASPAVVAASEALKPWHRDVLVARALGRALAHEVGHVLLATTQHAPRGLMRAQRSAADMFEPARLPFAIDETTRAAAARRAAALVARR
jgi:hypothetical protein